MKLVKNKNKKERKLEIGPGKRRIEGFETLNIEPGFSVDYIFDASKKLPFADGTFDLVYASHILEHIPWYHTENVLKEWARIIKPGGYLEIWVPDGLKIAKAFVDAETHSKNNFKQDGWFKFNEEQDSCKWASGRIFTYGDGTGEINNSNWHRALFSKRYLMKILERAGLGNIEVMSNNEVRGANHGWINLGIKGQK